MFHDIIKKVPSRNYGIEGLEVHRKRRRKPLALAMRRKAAHTSFLFCIDFFVKLIIMRLSGKRL